MSIETPAKCIHHGCNIITRRSNMCAAHLLSDYGVSIRPSTIPGAGLGLFTEVPRTAGEHICPYDGDDVYDTSKETFYPYGLETRGHWIIDAARTNTSPARYINDPRNRGLDNCRFVESTRRPFTVRVATTKAIRIVPSELFLPYGADYWNRAPNLQQKLIPVKYCINQNDKTPPVSDDEGEDTSGKRKRSKKNTT